MGFREKGKDPWYYDDRRLEKPWIDPSRTRGWLDRMPGRSGEAPAPSTTKDEQQPPSLDQLERGRIDALRQQRNEWLALLDRGGRREFKLRCLKELAFLEEQIGKLERGGPAPSESEPSEVGRKPSRVGILKKHFKTLSDWKDRTKVDACCQEMATTGIQYPPRRDAVPHGCDLGNWTDLIGKKKNHPEFARLFGDLRNSTLFTEWRKAKRTRKG